MPNIKLFESKKIRSVWSEEDQKWYFSVADVVGVLTDSTDVKQYIKRLRQREELLNSNWGIICTPLNSRRGRSKSPPSLFPAFIHSNFLTFTQISVK